MWDEINYSLETEQGIRHLVLRSNYETVPQGLIDHGDYSVWEDLTPYETMTEEEVDAHFEQAAHWNAGPYLDTHGIYLGLLHVDLSDPRVFTWNGKPDDLTLAQQAQLVDYLTTTDFEPDVDFDDAEDDDGDQFIFPSEGKNGVQDDGSIYLLESYKDNAVRVKLVPAGANYLIEFEDEKVGELVRTAGGEWEIQNELFRDEQLVERLINAITTAKK